MLLLHLRDSVGMELPEVLGETAMVPKKLLKYDKKYSKRDGYRWHKYGQKKFIEKNTIRSYYKCIYKSTQKCQARKFIDIDIRDPSKFSTSYFKEHNHPKPAHRKHLNQIESNKMSSDTKECVGETLQEMHIKDESIKKMHNSIVPQFRVEWETSSNRIGKLFTRETNPNSLEFQNKIGHVRRVSHGFSRRDEGHCIQDSRSGLGGSLVKSNGKHTNISEELNFVDPMSFLGGRNTLSIFDFMAETTSLNMDKVDEPWN